VPQVEGLVNEHPDTGPCCHAGIESLPTFIAPAQIMGGKTV
jgi:hypothetical protein